MDPRHILVLLVVLLLMLLWQFRILSNESSTDIHQVHPPSHVGTYVSHNEKVEEVFEVGLNLQVGQVMFRWSKTKDSRYTSTPSRPTRIDMPRKPKSKVKDVCYVILDICKIVLLEFYLYYKCAPNNLILIL